MKETLKIKQYTGNYYFKNRFFGGYDIYVEVIAYYVSGSPDIKYYKKATLQDLSNFELNLK